MTIRVDVTQKDLDEAQRGDSHHCAVADAVVRARPNANRIMVDIQAIRFSEGEYRYVYLTPHVVADYIVHFDAGEPVPPFSFILQRYIWRGLRVPAKGTSYRGDDGASAVGSEDPQTEDEPTTDGKATINVATTGTKRRGRRSGMILKVPALAPPIVRYTRGERIYGLRELVANRGKKGNRDA